ncbi:spermidine N1-acetyltransferase [Barrientosiimonas marina]|uniref:GNAT family N-acetyltransferase n=1 Tax=Lentibacillus kimchii TaxID=1542911 RepID=A0ABW2UWU1_9BACI
MEKTIQLRAVEKDDLSFLHKLLNNTDVMHYWFSEAHMSMEKLKEMLEKNNANDRNRSFILTDGQEPFGFVGIADIDPRHRHAEFSIMIEPAHQGNGYAGKATQLAMDYAFSMLNLHKLYLIVAKANDKARHVYEKAGFHTEGEMTEHFFVKGTYQDALMMGVFQQDYWNRQNH